MLQREKIELGDLVNLLERVLGLRFNLFFGELFVVKLNDFLDGARAVAKIFADLEEFLQDERSARDGFQDEQLSALDALGDGHFAFASKQRDRAHFAQVHAHGVIGFFERAGSQIKLAIFRGNCFRFFQGFSGISGIRGSKRSFRAGQIFVYINAVTLEGRE